MVKKLARKSPAKTKSRTPAVKKRAKATNSSKRSGHAAVTKAKKSPRTTAKTKTSSTARSAAKKNVKKPAAKPLRKSTPTAAKTPPKTPALKVVAKDPKVQAKPAKDCEILRRVCTRLLVITRHVVGIQMLIASMSKFVQKPARRCRRLHTRLLMGILLHCFHVSIFSNFQSTL